MRGPSAASPPPKFCMLLPAAFGAELSAFAPDAETARTELSREFLLGRNLQVLPRTVPRATFRDRGELQGVVLPAASLSFLAERTRAAKTGVMHFRYGAAESRAGGGEDDVGLGCIVKTEPGGTVVHLYEDPRVRYGSVDHLAGTKTYAGFATGICKRTGAAEPRRVAGRLRCEVRGGVVSGYLDAESRPIELNRETVLETDDLRAAAARRPRRERQAVTGPRMSGAACACRAGPARRPERRTFVTTVRRGRFQGRSREALRPFVSREPDKEDLS